MTYEWRPHVRRVHAVHHVVECRMAGCRWWSGRHVARAVALAEYDEHCQAEHPYQPIPAVRAREEPRLYPTVAEQRAAREFRADRR